MANTTTTPYMTLVLPLPGIELGPAYAIENNTAFTKIDQHTHIPGQGLPVPTAGMNIDGDLSFNSFNITTIRSSRYNNQISPLSLPTDINSVYVSGGNLYFNDVNGIQIQMTLAGAVNTSLSGTITGMGATTASVVYSSISKTFTFYSASVTPAFLATGPLIIGANTAGSNTVTLTPSLTIPLSYQMTFPDALPPDQEIMTVDASGQQAFLPTDGVTTGISGGKLTAFLPPGIIIAYGGTAAPTGWLICDGTPVSRTTYVHLYGFIGNAYGSGDGSTTFNLPDCRGVFLRGVSGATGRDPNASSRTASGSGGNTGNNVGSLQDSDFSSHTHIQNVHNHLQAAHSHGLTDPGHHHSIGFDILGAATGGSAVSTVTHATSLTSDSTTGISVQAITATNVQETAVNQATGGSETRPLNLYVNYLIKY